MNGQRLVTLFSSPTTCGFQCTETTGLDWVPYYLYPSVTCWWWCGGISLLGSLKEAHIKNCHFSQAIIFYSPFPPSLPVDSPISPFLTALYMIYMDPYTSALEYFQNIQQSPVDLLCHRTSTPMSISTPQHPTNKETLLTSSAQPWPFTFQVSLIVFSLLY